MKVKTIKRVGRKPVYDIEVKNSHSYCLENGIISHNSGLMYSANTVLLITKSMEKQGTELVGNTFNVTTMKSRFVREKAKIPITVTFDGGVDKFSGLLDLALAGNFIVKPSNGWYQKVDVTTGSVEEKKYRAKDMDKEFWQSILDNKDFKIWVENTFSIANRSLLDGEVIPNKEAVETFTNSEI